jgi:hypothetical protein
MRIQILKATHGFRAGIEDAVILPLVIVAVAAKGLCQAAISILVHVLDFLFPLAMQLARFLLFTARILGDGVVAAVQVLVTCLPFSQENRQQWHEFIDRKWSWLRGKISYRSFEEMVHRVFERGMEWVFKKCRTLTPRDALYVITGAVLWLPVSLGAATAIHGLLLVYAAALPAWMQLLHPLATIIAKSKLLVLPVYPAAWPQAKKHPFIRGIARGCQNFTSLYVVQKTARRYRQTEQAVDRAADVMGRVACRVGLGHFSNTLLSSLNGLAARFEKALHDAMSYAFERLSGLWLIGPVLRSYAFHYESVEQRKADKASEQLSGFFERWSVRFSAEYYEAKEREKGAKAASEKMPGSNPCPDAGMISPAHSEAIPPDAAR